MIAAMQIPGPLGMGGAPLGNLFAPVAPAVAAATVTQAWDSGVRLFDTAPHYGAGLSERRMGDAVRVHPRDAYCLSTKVGRRLLAPRLAPDDQGFVDELPFRRVWDYSADGTSRSIEDSLQRLGLERVDIVFIHDVSEDHHGPAWRDRFGEAMRGAAPSLSSLCREGTIGGWGLGSNLVEPCLAALEQASPTVFLVAGRYTLLDQTALAALFPACARRGVRVLVGGPYNSGLLAGGTTFNYVQAPPELMRRAAALRELCARHGADLKAVALQFCAAHPAVAAVIPGARTPEEMRENAAMMQAPVPGALWRALRQSGLVPEAVPLPGGE